MALCTYEGGEAPLWARSSVPLSSKSPRGGDEANHWTIPRPTPRVVVELAAVNGGLFLLLYITSYCAIHEKYENTSKVHIRHTPPRHRHHPLQPADVHSGHSITEAPGVAI